MARPRRAPALSGFLPPTAEFTHIQQALGREKRQAAALEVEKLLTQSLHDEQKAAAAKVAAREVEKARFGREQQRLEDEKEAEVAEVAWLEAE